MDEVKRLLSDAKLAANRANAKLSTGPQSAAMKQKVSMNALRHGLTSASAFVLGDDKEIYDSVIQDHYDYHNPETAQERNLVQLIAENSWRILKVAPEEEAIYDIGRLKYGPELFTEITDPIRRAGLLNAQIGIIYEKPLRNIRLHERRLRRQQDKDIDTLKKMQTERRERAERENKEAGEAKVAILQSAKRIIEMCRDKQLPCNLKEFGFVFSAAEYEEVNERNFKQYQVTGEFLDFYELLNLVRQDAA